MQLVLSNNRIIAHGENFLAMGGVVINTETGAKYENATIAECNGCPSDIDKVGYEYHAGVFVPCAPFAGNGNNNGYFMEVCESCATPRNSGIPIKGGLKLENLNETLAKQLSKTTLLWENASPYSEFSKQSVYIGGASSNVDFFIIFAVSVVASWGTAAKNTLISAIVPKNASGAINGEVGTTDAWGWVDPLSVKVFRGVYHETVNAGSANENNYLCFGNGYYNQISSNGTIGGRVTYNAAGVPYRIYGVKL